MRTKAGIAFVVTFGVQEESYNIQKFACLIAMLSRILTTQSVIVIKSHISPE